jgi:hypothetical protein
VNALVIGTLPPPVTDRTRGLLAEVLRLRREGAAVRVLSPTPNSVAHEYLELPGAAAAVEVAQAVRKADLVVVQLEPGFPVEESATKAGRAFGLASLAMALRSAHGEVVLRLHSAHDLPFGAGGRAAEALWARAVRIEVGTEESLEQLASSLPPAAARKLVVAVPPAQIGGGREARAATAEIGAGAGLDAATAVVRARAASERAFLLADHPDAAGQVRARQRVALWEWAPSAGVGVPQFALETQAVVGNAGSPARRAARAVLLAAEARPLTRPIARGARTARRVLTKF